jgi:hypothetical protein
MALLTLGRFSYESRQERVLLVGMMALTAEETINALFEVVNPITKSSPQSLLLPGENLKEL